MRKKNLDFKPLVTIETLVVNNQLVDLLVQYAKNQENLSFKISSLKRSSSLFDVWSDHEIKLTLEILCNQNIFCMSKGATERIIFFTLIENPLNDLKKMDISVGINKY